MKQIVNNDVSKDLPITYLGSHSSMAILVDSGSFVGVFTQQSRFAMRCTCVSTPIPVTVPQATLIAMCAIFGPTPGRAMSSSRDGGMSSLYFSLQIFVACLI